MVQSVKNILFASDLSTNMKQIFEHAATLAINQDAHIIVLHVMEEHTGTEKKIRMAFGENLYQDLKSEQKAGARNVLIGKNVDALKIQQAISGFFKGAEKSPEGVADNSLIKKILVSEGRSIADEITSTVREENCDLIVMGCKQQSLLAEAMGDHVVRKILKRSTVPVFVVPVTDQ